MRPLYKLQTIASLKELIKIKNLLSKTYSCLFLQYFFHKIIFFQNITTFHKNNQPFQGSFSVFLNTAPVPCGICIFLIYAAGTCDTAINLSQQLGRRRATWRNYFRGKQPAWSGSMPVGLSTSLTREQEISKCIFQLSLKGSFWSNSTDLVGC